RYGIVARRGENLSAIRDTVAQIRRGELNDISQLNFMDLVQVDELAIDETDPLRAEMQSFLDAAQGKCPPAVTAEQGLAAVELATQIVESIAPQSLEYPQWHGLPAREPPSGKPKVFILPSNRSPPPPITGCLRWSSTITFGSGG